MAIIPKISRRFWRFIASILQRIRIIYYKQISSNKNIFGTPIIIQPLLTLGNNQIIFNGRVTIGYFPSPFFYSGYSHFETRDNSSIIEFGHNIHLNNNSTLIADGAKIVFGDNVLAGTNLTAYTSDFHSLNPLLRHTSSDYPKKDVVICDNVFLGSNVTILKGVTIGRNSVIANGSVVSSDIAENVIAGGIPCRIIKQL
jgi:maltose O-acetyltransferase